ncbi:MAG: nucleoside-triphosphatase [Elusimicrobiota bacterium]|jgi:nucleoside-triphosphatase THEP1
MKPSRASDSDGLWRKAAVLGSLWAASEIVLGSFFHNTRVPLRGHILTGIGIAILVAGHRLWPQRGLLWRAGLICAAMKSVSPSAVILGPMVAISMEGFLLELGVLLGGANVAGYLLAGGLAMSWALVQKVGGFFLYYGPDAWTLYGQGLERLRVWLGTSAIDPWKPLLWLWAGHMAAGVVAAGIGIRVGSYQGAGLSASGKPTDKKALPPAPKARAPGDDRYSLAVLVLHFLLIVAIMALGQKAPVWALAAGTLLYVGLCVRAYPRACAIMKRFNLWLGILVVSVLAGLILGRWEAGAQMALRAVVLTIGFSCVGSELRNPAIRSWLAGGRGKVFFEALEQAFDTLPEVFASFPTGRQIAISPVAALASAIARAPALLDGLDTGRVVIITGSRGEGKSKLVGELAEALAASGLSVGGIHAPGYWEGGKRAGFDIVDLATGERRALCRAGGKEGGQVQGKFRFSDEGIAFGLKALETALEKGADVIVVDEVGPLELQGRGWAPALDSLAAGRRKPMVWVVRPELVALVKRRWRLAEAVVWRADAGLPGLWGQILRFEFSPDDKQAVIRS